MGSPRSPDLNPVEKYWAWLRRQLRRLDLRDAVQKKPVLEKPAYRARVQRVMKTAKSKAVAQAIIKGFRKTCQDVVESGGMAARKG